MKYYIIVFKNTHDAMSGEDKFEKLGYKFRMMPTPTSITQSCGICIRVEEQYIIEEIINNNSIEFKNIYERNNNEYSVIK